MTAKQKQMQTNHARTKLTKTYKIKKKQNRLIKPTQLIHATSIQSEVKKMYNEQMK